MHFPVKDLLNHYPVGGGAVQSFITTPLIYFIINLLFIIFHKLSITKIFLTLQSEKNTRH